jgi:hypothetical protein
MLCPKLQETWKILITDNKSVAVYLIVLAKNLEEMIIIVKKCPILNGQNPSVGLKEITRKMHP